MSVRCSRLLPKFRAEELDAAVGADVKMIARIPMFCLISTNCYSAWLRRTHLAIDLGVHAFGHNAGPALPAKQSPCGRE